jgi:phosphoglycolate phosphatase
LNARVPAELTADDRPVILFDLDGTVLDSAPGIIRTLQRAMHEVGIEPADDATLRSDLGPPPAVILARLGVPEKSINPAVLAYRRHYLDTGLQEASVFDGVMDMLVRLGTGYRLATATMKRIETAVPFLTHHGLRDHFVVVGGAQDGIADKAAIIGATRIALGEPPADRMIMVGDRHSDITGGREHGLHTIAVTWGYGSRAELEASEPDAIIDRPDQLPDVVDQLLLATPA